VVVIVLGMHKSGTTLVAEMLHSSGIDMGRVDWREGSYDTGKKYEDPEASLITKAVLGVSWTHKSYDIPKTPHLHDDERLQKITDDYVVRRTQRNESWGFKEPRVCLAFSHWKRSLPDDFRIIYVVRDPIELWKHYTKRYRWYAIIARFRRGILAIRAWNIYNDACLSIADSESSLCLRFSSLMSDPDRIKTISRWLGIAMIDVRKPGLYRSRVYSWTDRVRFDFSRLICDSIFGTKTREVWRRIVEITQRREGSWD
jgi:hypothetical protein